jgi:protease I
MNLSGKRAVVLAEKMYEDLELWYPLLRLRGAGMAVQVVGTGSDQTYPSKHGYPVQVDTTADMVSAKDVDAVIVPGGYAPDYLRRHPAVLQLVRDVFNGGKIVAAICHGGWVLASAGILKGRKMTSVPAIKDDMVNAGAKWVDQEVVQDGNLITSRKPDDLPGFTDAIIGALGGVEAAGLDRVTEKTSATEALCMAIQAEEAAYRFYSMAVQRVKDAEAKNVFSSLAKEEERHRKIVQDEYQRLTVNPDWDRYSIWRDLL